MSESGTTRNRLERRLSGGRRTSGGRFAGRVKGGGGVGVAGSTVRSRSEKADEKCSTGVLPLMTHCELRMCSATGIPAGYRDWRLIASLRPTENVQFMVEDSKKYAATGGWGIRRLQERQRLHKTCFSCHDPAEDRDFVFARYAPTP